MKHSMYGIVLPSLLALAAGFQAQAEQIDLLITGVSIVDVNRNAVSEARDIAITGGIIVGVEEAGTISTEAATTVLEAKGLYALAGLIDVHAHIGDGGLGAQSKEDRERALAQFLRYGVTTIFVPGGGGGNDHDLARWKARCRKGELSCPDLYGSGALITAPGSHPIGTIWGLPDDVDPQTVYERGAVAVAESEAVGPLLDHKKSMGVDAIKIVIEDGIGPRYPMPRLSKKKVAELVREAHRRSLEVFAHVSMAEHVADGVAAGIDGIMHSSDEPIPDSVLAEMAREGIFYVATLALLDTLFEHARGRFETEAYAKAGVSTRALRSLEGFRSDAYETADEATAVEAAVRANLRRAAAAGAPLALGSDVNNPHVFPGYSAHQELALMVEAGLSPQEALAAATTGGAAFLGRSDVLGKVKVQFEADLLLLAANPLDDILNSRTIFRVVADGRVLDDVVRRSDHQKAVPSPGG